MKGSKNQVVEAHKFVLALRSDVFRAQFYGSLKSEEEEVKTDWNYKDFKFFISTFYDQVDLRKRSLQSLSGLFHLSDYYNVPEIKNAILKIIKSKSGHLSEEEVAEAAFYARANDVIHPDLSRPLYDQVLGQCGTDHSGIEKFFNQHR